MAVHRPGEITIRALGQAAGAHIGAGRSAGNRRGRGDQRIAGVVLAVVVRVLVEIDRGQVAGGSGQSVSRQRDRARRPKRSWRMRVERADGRPLRHVGLDQFQGFVSVQPAAAYQFSADRGQRIDALEQGIADLGHGGVGIDGPAERGDARHIGRGHARARVRGKLVAGQRAIDRHAGGGQIDRSWPRSC